MPKVTVVICTYNRAEMLRESLQSVISQTYNDMEIIVLDNCSTDHTKNVVMQFDDQRISYICNDSNLGAFGNLNRALKISNSEYLNIFHDDDRMFPWMIEEEVRILDKNPIVGVVGTSEIHVLGTAKVPPKPECLEGELLKQDEFVKATCERGGVLMVASSAMFRKKDLDAINTYFRIDVGIAADMFFWLEANHKGLNMYLLDQPLFEYRKHEGAASIATPVTPWIESYQKVDAYVASLELGCDVRTLHGSFVTALLSRVIQEVREKSDFGLLLSLRRLAQEKYRWSLSDADFNQAATMLLLGPCVIDIREGRTGIRSYFVERKKWATQGLSIPISREMKWLLKQIIVKCFGRKK